MNSGWNLDKGNDGAVISNDAGTIATVSNEMTAWSANADLLFAAPDMLAALQSMLSPLETLAASARKDGARTYVDGNTFQNVAQAFSMAGFRAAIAKATGGAVTEPAPAPAVTVAECLEVLKQIRDGSNTGRWLDDSGSECAEGEGEWTEFDLEEQSNWIQSTAAMADALIAKAEGRAQ